MIVIRNTEAIFKEPPPYYTLPFLIPLILISSIWINDTMAYIVGSFIGKTSLSKISPKKTWEGTIGGAVLCIATVTLIGYYLLNIRDVTSLIVISSIAAIVPVPFLLQGFLPVVSMPSRGQNDRGYSHRS